jgi:hypothetical protein
MRVPVDTAREPARHHEPGRRELAAEHARDLDAVRGTRARTDDRDRGTVEQLRLSCAAEEQPRRRIEDRRERGREGRGGSRQPAQAALLESGEIATLVELTLEAREALVPRRGDEVRIRVGPFAP